MTLYARSGGRKYLNAAERRRFLQAAEAAPRPVRGSFKMTVKVRAPDARFTCRA